ncbi:hypothetical protein [Asanoa sp. NPDC050611]|uniref:hypothetical protein n=1 Tax=Asanoa sp. NPDC050611 TaxID=3157098 RepID=UPI003405210D
MTQEPVERGASEQSADSPLTDTEVEASRRPPSSGDDEPRPEEARRDPEQEPPD